MKKDKKDLKKIEWYMLNEKDVLEILNSSRKGLSNEEAEERLKKYGKNELPKRIPPSIFRIIFDQLINPLIYILIAAFLISVFLGDIKDAIFIFIVIFINTVIGSYQEWKAEKSSEALSNLLKICIKVKREEEIKVINAENLVPGDIVLLESGGKVPADIRILKQTNLMADESLLTGESVEVAKNIETIDKKVHLSDRVNMLYAGTIITSGRGLGVITETGLTTEIGKIAQAVTSVEKTKPPLIRRMEKFSHQISIVVLLACALIAFIEFSRGSSDFDVFFLAVALAVSAIPEGLPAALTVALSVGMSRMAKRNVIIRKLPAVEGLGSCTLIASDKTGTLTVNKQTVKLIYLADGAKYTVTGEGYSGEGKVLCCRDKHSLSNIDELVKSAIICNEGSLRKKRGEWLYHGDAVDVALLAMGYKYGLESEEMNKKIHPIWEIPFESERKYSAKFYKEGEEVRVALKGALEVVLGFCTNMRSGDNIVQLDNKRIERQLKSISRTGHRVIALAEGKILKKTDHAYYEEDLKGLTYLGLVGLIDPLRPEAKHAVDTCKQAGIKVIMITGDHPETSLTIGRNLGIVESKDQVIVGAALSEFDEKSKEYLEFVNSATVFARVTPIQKLHIVEALARSGNFIAVTGDGVNDAPALKKAHISVAMGSGTDVAKDVSSMIVVDDNFASVVAGVEEGRYAYDNIRKVVYLLISTGASEIVLFLLAIGFSLPIPLTAVQLLWLNLVTNGIQGVGLSFEKGEEESMKKPPRSPAEGIFNKLMIEETFVSGISIGVIAFSLWFALLAGGFTQDSARNMTLLLMVLFENIHVFNCRSEYKSAFKVPISNNILLITGVIVAQAIHVISMNVPLMQDVLEIQPVGIKEWMLMLVLAGSMLLIMEIFKLFKSGRFSVHKT